MTLPVYLIPIPFLHQTQAVFFYNVRNFLSALVTPAKLALMYSLFILLLFLFSIWLHPTYREEFLILPVYFLLFLSMHLKII